MKEQITAKAYAKSIIELGEEQKLDVAEELTKFQELINKCDNLENVLFLDVFTPEEKSAVINDILGKVGTAKLVGHFLNFLAAEKRLSLLPLIYKEVIVIDDHKKGFMRGTIEGAESDIASADKDKLVSYIKSKIGKEVILDYKENAKVGAGYRVTVEDLQLDASLDNQLNKFKNDVLNA